MIVVDNNSTDDTREVVEAAPTRVSGAAPLPVRAGAGAQRGAEPRRSPGARRDHRHDRRRRAGRAGLAGADRRRPRSAAAATTSAGGSMPLWGAAPPNWLPESQRRALGGDRAARLRPGADRSSASACRSASTWRSGAQRSIASGGFNVRGSAGRPARCSGRKCASGASAHTRPACAASTCRRSSCSTSFRPIG